MRVRHATAALTPKEGFMGKTAKIITGLGVLAGISYYGRRKMTTEELAARGGGFLGYVKGMGRGFYLGVKSAFHFRKA
jgi:hypothetical protein